MSGSEVAIAPVVPDVSGVPGQQEPGLSREALIGMGAVGGATLTFGGIGAAVKINRSLNRRRGFANADSKDKDYFNTLEQITPGLRALEESLSISDKLPKEQLEQMQHKLQDLKKKNNECLLA